MVHEATLEYTEPLLRQAVLAFCRRGFVRYLIALAILAGMFAFEVWSGDRSWFVGFLGAVLILGLGFALSIYFGHLRNSLAKFRAMGASKGLLTLDQATFSLSSSLGSSTLQWSEVTEVWQFQDFWLLLFSRAQFVTIPLASVSAEAQEFIICRVSVRGGNIVG
jgi:hypothetical protein